ncbi:MAG: hypothetical protein MUP47_05300 [Phycisphaerae bacterium]|nr:hypothetical protein [Phycisphaerae bacterium]
MTATFAEQMVAKYRQLLLENAGLVTINIDGQDVSYADLETKLEHWEGKVAKQRGRAPSVSRIRLDGS